MVTALTCRSIARLVNDSTWKKTIPSIGLNGPQRNAADTVATYDLTLANLGASAADWSGITVADGAQAWPIKVITGPVSAAHDVSVTVSTDAKVRVEATRSTGGRCWYLVNNDEASAENGGVLGLPRIPHGDKLTYASPRGVTEPTCNSGPVETSLQRVMVGPTDALLTKTGQCGDTISGRPDTASPISFARTDNTRYVRAGSGTQEPRTRLPIQCPYVLDWPVKASPLGGLSARP